MAALTGATPKWNSLSPRLLTAAAGVCHRRAEPNRSRLALQFTPETAPPTALQNLVEKRNQKGICRQEPIITYSMAVKNFTKHFSVCQMVARCLHVSRCDLQLGTALQPDGREIPKAIFRSSELDPENHGEQQIGQFYTIPDNEVKSVFPHGLPYRFQQQIKTFNETSVMVRHPAVEVIGYMKKANYSHPCVRYILYGERGTGKSLSLCHILHYCARKNWVIVHIPDAHLWLKNCRELMPSSYNASRFDQPVEASVWLKNFRITNERFLKQMKTQQKYIWSKREFTDEGHPLIEVIDQGLTRVKNASDSVGIVLKELKAQCQSGTFKLVVGVDGVNALWGQTTLRKEDKSPVNPGELTLIHNLRKLMKNDWNNGAVVATVTQTGSLFTPKAAYLPHELLGKDGFDFLDPFLPIQVTGYSEREFESCYQYYKDRHWIQHEKAHTENGKKELIFLSNRNPAVLERICSFL